MLKLARVACGITLLDLQEELGVSASFLSRVESGQRVAVDAIHEKLWKYLSSQMTHEAREALRKAARLK